MENKKKVRRYLNKRRSRAEFRKYLYTLAKELGVFDETVKEYIETCADRDRGILFINRQYDKLYMK